MFFLMIVIKIILKDDIKIQTKGGDLPILFKEAYLH